MRRGYTLVELVVALGIVTILAAIGWSSLRDYIPRFRLVGAAKMLRADINELRNTALATNRQTRLVLTGSGGDCSDRDTYGGSWRLEIGDASRNSKKWDVLPADLVETGADADQSEGVRDIGPDGARKARGVCLEAWDTLSGPGTGNDDAIVFSTRGWVENPFEDFDSRGYFVLTFVNQVAARNGATDEIAVTVSRAGVVQVSTPVDEADRPELGTGTASVSP